MFCKLTLSSNSIKNVHKVQADTNVVKTQIKPSIFSSSLSISLCSNSQITMQISLSNLAFKTPQLFPIQHPIFPPKAPLYHHQVSTQSHVNNVLKGSSGYLSEISKVIDHEEQYRVARSQVSRKVLDLEGYSIEGLSVGGQETCIIIPEFKCSFDIGRCPSRAIQQNFLFITHAHLDHIVRFSTFVTNNVFCVGVFVLFCFGLVNEKKSYALWKKLYIFIQSQLILYDKFVEFKIIILK